MAAAGHRNRSVPRSRAARRSLRQTVDVELPASDAVVGICGSTHRNRRAVGAAIHGRAKMHDVQRTLRATGCAGCVRPNLHLAHRRSRDGDGEVSLTVLIEITTHDGRSTAWT